MIAFINGASSSQVFGTEILYLRDYKNSEKWVKTTLDFKTPVFAKINVVSSLKNPQHSVICKS